MIWLLSILKIMREDWRVVLWIGLLLFLLWLVYALDQRKDLRESLKQATQRAQTLSAAYTTLGASVRDLSQKQRQTEESYDAIRRQAAARGKVDGCELCDPVRGDLDGLRRAEAGRLHPDPGQ
jgi:hypothetical protein